MLSIQSERQPLESIAYPRLRRVLDHWTAIGGGRPVPLRRDVDPVEMREALGVLTIARLELALDDFRVSLFGTELSRVRGGDETGKLVGQLQPARYGRFLRDSYRSVITSRSPWYGRVRLAIDTALVEYSCLILPLAEADGSVHAVLAALQYHKDMWNLLHEEMAEQARRARR